MHKNLAWTAVSIGSRLMTNLLLFIILARAWGPGGFGTFSVAFSTATLIALIVDFGFAAYVLREVGAREELAASLVRDALWAKLLLVLPCCLVAAVVVHASGEAIPLALVAPMLLSAMLLSFSDIFSSALRGVGRFFNESVIVSACNLLQFFASAGAAMAGASAVMVCWIFVAARLVMMLALVVSFVRSHPQSDFRPMGFTRLREVYLALWPYGIDNTLSVGWAQLDVIVVRMLYGTHIVGLYAAGQRVIQGLSAMAPIFGNVVIPRLARAAHSRDSRTVVLSARAMCVIWAVGLVLALPLVLVPQQMTRLLFSTGYVGLAEFLPLFGVLLLTRYLAAGTGMVMTALGLQLQRVVSQGVGLLLFCISVAAVAAGHWPVTVFLLLFAISVLVMAAMNLKTLISLRRGFP